MPDREASVFHRYSAFLARRAGGIVLRWTICCALLGGALGAVTLSGWAHWPVPHREAYLVVLLGAVCGAVLGRTLGSGRAQMARFHAQLAQHQLEFERRLFALAAAVQSQSPAVVVEESQSEPVYLRDRAPGFDQGFALPALPEPEPAWPSQHASAEVVQLVPRPDPPVAPLPDEASAPAAPPVSVNE